MVEKKADEGLFEVVGRVEGKGTTDSYSEYQFLDQSPMGRVNVYRLRQVAVDGTTSLSNQVEVRFDGNIAPRLLLFPSPAHSFAWLRVNGNPDEVYRLLLTDMQGKVLVKEQFTGTEQHRIGLQGLPEGVYLLRVEGNRGVSFVRKLVKLNP